MKKSEIIVHIHRPVLTEEERARRLECIRYAAVQVTSAWAPPGFIETSRAVFPGLGTKRKRG